MTYEFWITMLANWGPMVVVLAGFLWFCSRINRGAAKPFQDKTMDAMDRNTAALERIAVALEKRNERSGA